MIKALFFASAAILFIALYFHNVIEFDQDLGRHLLTGKIIWETHQVPLVNLYSYTYPNFPFINSHWLSEVVFYLIGLPRLVIFKTLIMSAAMLLTLFTTYKYSKNLAATALAFALFAPVLLERTEIRPEMFSYLFIAAFMYVLLLKPKFIWLLPVIELFWVNMHIYFIIGPIFMAIYCLSNRRFSWPAVVVCLVTLVNPNGLASAIYPLRVFDNYGYSIVENQNIFFLRDIVFNPNIFYFGVAGLALLGSFLVAGRRLLTPINCLLAGLLILPVLHIRSFPLLFLIELPVFAVNLSGIKKYSKVIIGAVLAITLFRSFRLASNEYYLSVDSPKRFGQAVTESGRGAVDFVLANHLSGPIFNNFDIGSYLDYRLYPEQKVFVDGRPEAYPAKFLQNVYIPMQESAANFAIIDQIYKFNLIIFSRTDSTPWGRQFATDITHNEKFTLAYIDDNMVVYVRRDTYPQIPIANIPPPPNNPFIMPTGLILF